MKTLLRNSLCTLLCIWAAAALAASPPIDVTVSDASGKVAFKGRTAANGTFATPKLQPGNYTVQFNSAKLAGNHAIVISAGKKKVTADAVAAQKFTKGGVAMKVEVGSGLNITGQVAPAGAAMAGSGNAKVKVENGKRYVWVEGETGSNIRGRWVEEGTVSARNVDGMSKDSFRNMQDRGGSGGMPGN